MGEKRPQIDISKATPEQSQQTFTILIVDDSRISQEMLRLNLEQHGYEFAFASNGQEAIQALSDKQSIDLILLDLMMPVMDGFSFLDWRKSNPHASDIPVIVNSSLDDFESIASALEMGAYDYFQKPLSKETLGVVLPLKIRNAITSRTLLTETRRQNAILQQEMRMAARYQKFLLPGKTAFPEAQAAYLFQPCSAVGGDYFDFIELGEGKIALILADVSGHGLVSAMTATIIKALLPGYLQKSESPSTALYALNDDLLRLTQDDAFATAFAAIYDPRSATLTWSAGGHPPPLFLPLGKKPKRLVSNTPFLGVFKNDDPFLNYTDNVLSIKSGEAIAFYTDGLIDAPNPQGKRFGLSRLETFLEEMRGEQPQKICDLLWEHLQDFTQGFFPDDLAFILIKL